MNQLAGCGKLFSSRHETTLGKKTHHVPLKSEQNNNHNLGSIDIVDNPFGEAFCTDFKNDIINLRFLKHVCPDNHTGPKPERSIRHVDANGGHMQIQKCHQAWFVESECP